MNVNKIIDLNRKGDYMKYSDYDKRIYNEEDILNYKRMFEKDIAEKQRELSEFLDRANDRLKWLNACEEDKRYIILGRACKNGKNKDILLIIRYEDGTQRAERYSYSKISDMRSKLEELKNKYSNVDWSQFVDEF